MSTRRNIWEVGLGAFPEHPVLGVGAGAYGTLLENRGNRSLPAHNVFIGLLVEQGVAGLLLFSALIGACALTIFRMPPSDRTLWSVLMLSWFVGLGSLSLERWKVTWLLFGLLSAQSGAASLWIVRGSERMRADVNGVAPLLGPSHPPRTVRTSASH
jgi:O-antigen ligase